MKHYTSLKFVSLLLLITLAFGCSLSLPKKIHKKSSIVGATINDQNASVEIREELNEQGNVIKKNFNHPYYFTGSGLANILSSIYYKKKSLIKGSTGRRKLFRQEELQTIIPPIISAFSMATDSQDILVFSTSDKILLADRQSYFSMFITDSNLNIVFSTIQSKKNLTDGRAFRKSNKNKFKDPLDVKRSSYWSLVPMGGQRLASGRQNWLIIDLSSNLFGVASTDNANISDNINDISIPSNRSSAIERKIRTNKSFIQEKKKYQGVREKLRELRDLRDEELISEKDYDAKKKELLNKF
ncbi:MAG: SHOCT domain-containing protein [Candidatus Scalindua sp.]